MPAPALAGDESESADEWPVRAHLGDEFTEAPQAELLPSPLHGSITDEPAGSFLKPPSGDYPPWLRKLEKSPLQRPPEPPPDDSDHFQLVYPTDSPNGFAGRSRIRPLDEPADAHFVPMPDRWRSGFPTWDRNRRGFPLGEDYPYKQGSPWDPYNQNVLKGDYPILGEHTFLNLTASSVAVFENRQVPTPTTPFESTSNPFEEEFFGDPNQFVYRHNFLLSFDFFHGDAGFKPVDWRLKLTPVFNVNYLDVNELGIVNPSVLKGTTRGRSFFALEEWFVESKLADLSPNYDFFSVRAGSQPIESDFRGFIFHDINRAVRLFGTRHANRDQFNVFYVDQTEKDTNSLLNTFNDRHQDTIIANYFRQDFIWPGYTTGLNFHFNHDRASMKFDRNGFLVRPDPAGVFAPHDIKSYYVGWIGDGHINRVNLTHALYWVFGHDSLNPIAGQEQQIEAQMAALELSYDRDWMRFRTSLFWSSGDDNPNDGRAEGFDAIFDNPNFAGGEFSYWQRQAFRLFGVNLVNNFSLIPNLRSSKIQGQTNFVNPGLALVNFGVDADLTPKLKAISNVNFLWFDDTDVLETFVFQEHIRHEIGTDLSLGFEYRPLLNDNIQLALGFSGFVPGDGYDDLFAPFSGDASKLFAAFFEIVTTY